MNHSWSYMMQRNDTARDSYEKRTKREQAQGAREASGSARTVRASCVSRFTHCATLCKPYTSEFNSVGRYTGGVFISVKRRAPMRAAIARPLTHAAATRHSTCVLTVTLG